MACHPLVDSLVEYAYIESYISSSAVYGDKKNNLESKYGTIANLDAFYAWRDAHALSQIYFYGWVIDYWMEKGLYRDVRFHELFSRHCLFYFVLTVHNICHTVAIHPCYY